MHISVISNTQHIKLLILDVDGVLTDGSIYIDADGRESKRFNVLDGQGIRMLQDTGVQVAIISGRTSTAVTARAAELNIQHLYQGVNNKVAAFEMLLQKLALTGDECAFMGDDLIDIAVMRRCALAVAVPDAQHLVCEAAQYITKKSGGKGAVREVCEFIMQVQGNYDKQVALYIH